MIKEFCDRCTKETSKTRKLTFRGEPKVWDLCNACALDVLTVLKTPEPEAQIVAVEKTNIEPEPDPAIELAAEVLLKAVAPDKATPDSVEPSPGHVIPKPAPKSGEVPPLDPSLAGAPPEPPSDLWEPGLRACENHACDRKAAEDSKFCVGCTLAMTRVNSKVTP